MTLKLVPIVLAIAAVLDPVTGALVHNCGSVFVVVNPALLLRWESQRVPYGRLPNVPRPSPRRLMGSNTLVVVYGARNPRRRKVARRLC